MSDNVYTVNPGLNGLIPKHNQDTSESSESQISRQSEGWHFSCPSTGLDGVITLGSLDDIPSLAVCMEGAIAINNPIIIIPLDSLEDCLGIIDCTMGGRPPTEADTFGVDGVSKALEKAFDDGYRTAIRVERKRLAAGVQEYLDLGPEPLEPGPDQRSLYSFLGWFRNDVE